MTYREHRKELLKDRKVMEEYNKLLPEYELARSIIKQRVRKKLTQEQVAKKAGIPSQQYPGSKASPTDFQSSRR